MKKILSAVFASVILFCFSGIALCSELETAIKNGDLETVQWIINNNLADVNAGTDLSLLPLTLAVKNGNIEITKFLLEKGADVNKEDIDLPPLHRAAENEHIEIIKLLLEKGADVNKQCFGITPLHIAAGKGNIEIIKFLLERGADINCNAKLIGTPLHSAINRGHIMAVNLLIEKGADVNASCVWGTPLQCARRERYKIIAKILTDHGAIEPIEEKKPETKNKKELPKKSAAGPGGGGIDVYTALVIEAVRPKWSIPVMGRKNYQVQIRIKMDKNGKVLDCSIEKSSGHTDVDASAVNAVKRTGTLPKPPTSEKRNIVVIFNTQDL